ncbi:MAG: TIGR01777 family oxidoreductase [Propionicimonas sp.]|uniref:TIGR01777 family oxidoreductase n=1 Tax=Propionicimonas sp. TaxID=1955623 RepID=UPI002B1EE793|nr:TIGR01777 family oxidoreductase [Propionicimonas sp.]MEA4943228.1 TIGR01777 family oxidoreductase [Propionicimonas sp.]MEA5055829.1 TIGR01777 family oxidoreductase [Propionicimonas sp.]MEA5117872.1 TIGR01777 family oxidoreductase [Propionicimonas sp.]
MRVAIAGSSGMLGTALARELTGSGHEVIRLVRGRPTAAAQRHWNPDAGRIDAPGLADVDAVVNLAGTSIAGGRWTKERKAALRRSRIVTTLTIVTSLEPDGRCQRMLNASAVGYYGNTGIEIVDEQFPGGRGFLAGLCHDWEAAAGHSAVPTVTLRTGHVLAPEGGFLAIQRPLFALGLGGRIGDGRQFVSWISLPDHIRAMIFLLGSDLTGPFNLTAPHPVTNAAFTRAYGRFLNRPTLVPTPLVAVKALFGGEFVTDALLSSTRAIPARLLEAGFSFRHPHISRAFAAMPGGKATGIE